MLNILNTHLYTHIIAYKVSQRRIRDAYKYSEHVIDPAVRIEQPSIPTTYVGIPLSLYLRQAERIRVLLRATWRRHAYIARRHPWL